MWTESSDKRITYFLSSIEAVMSTPTSLDEKAAVREMLRQKRNEGGRDDAIVNKNVRIRSLDERIAMKNQKPWGITTMMSISEKVELKGAIQTDQTSEAVAMQLSHEDKLRRKLAEDNAMKVRKSTIASDEVHHRKLADEDRANQASAAPSYEDKLRRKVMDDKAGVPEEGNEVVTDGQQTAARIAFEERLQRKISNEDKASQASAAPQLSYEDKLGRKLMDDKAGVPKEANEVVTDGQRTAARIAFEERLQRKIANEDEEPASQEKPRTRRGTVGASSHLTMSMKDRNRRLGSLIGHFEGDVEEKETSSRRASVGASSHLTMSIMDRNRRLGSLICHFEEDEDEDEKQQAMPEKGRKTHGSTGQLRKSLEASKKMKSSRQCRRAGRHTARSKQILLL